MMKLLCWSLQLLVLTVWVGCSVLNIPRWDPREYNELITIAAESSRGFCSQEQIDHLTALTRHLRLYSAYLPDNEKIAAGAVALDTTALELTPAGKVSATYCQLKLKTIHVMATTLAQAAGGKPK